MISTQDVEDIAAAVSELPEVAWSGGYPELEFCILDSIFSVNAKYTTTVVPMVDRYRHYRNGTGTGTAHNLIDAVEAAGGPYQFAVNVLRNRQRTSTRNGILKAEACLIAAQTLVDHGVTNTVTLRGRFTQDQ